MKQFVAFLLASAMASVACANVTLPKIFGDGMVLQRGQAIPVWGWAGKGEKITVQFNKQTATATADKNGKWRIDLAAERAGGPYTFVVKGKNTLTLNDVLVGDVWICSGQSNMEWPLSASKNAEAEIRAAAYPQIRHFKVVNSISDTPKEDLMHESKWNAATPENAGNFTAIGYFFARDLYNELKVPIGLINTTWGGTDVETWTSRAAFESSAEFKDLMQGMPKLNLDSVAAQRKAAMLKKLQALQGGLPDAAAIASFSTLSFDDSKWPQLAVPGLWETTALPDFDGVVWFRKTINLTAADASKSAQLFLGAIDDNDETYVNGVKVGSTKSYNTPRVYTLAPNILKEGKNVIAVRVDDTGGGGGFSGPASELKLVIDNRPESLSGNWAFQVEKVQEGASSVSPNAYPTLLYNAMVHPLIPFAFKGVIWYQGENNAGRAAQYSKAFPLLILDWRRQWKQGDFPFYFVQLASFNAANGTSKTGSTWAELREAQTQTLSLPNTGMAVTTDIGEAGDIHPKNKQDVGKRLAAIALHNVYGKSNVFSGPQYQSQKVEGNTVRLSFSNMGGGLMTPDKYGYLKGFEVAGADQQFHYAKATINGATMVVQADSVAAPVAVRYAWADDAGDANLYNREGFPALPFRTDNWKRATEGVKYMVAK